MEFHEITMADQAVVDAYTRGEIFDNCEMTFANMFMWRQGWALTLCRQEEALYLLSRRAGQAAMQFQPMVKPGLPVAGAVEKALADLESRGQPPIIVGVNQRFKDRLEAESQAYVVEEDRDMDEYIYSVPDLIALAGKKYHAKRNHIAKFRQDIPYTWRSIDGGDEEECMALFDRWAAEHPPDDDITAERAAILESLRNFQALELKAGGIEVDGQLAAFTIGGFIHPQLAVIHFEKADASYPGIYAVLNQEFLQREFAQVPFVNRQEDMGIPGLRKAKESYHPCCFARKYFIRRA